MREGAECGGKSDVLPANQSLRRRGVSDGIGGGSRKKDGGAWGIPRHTRDLKNALKRKFERKYGMTVQNTQTETVRTEAAPQQGGNT
ncbi:hypothetical protein FXU45_002137, partial [Neisseria gonorrhoeae]